METDEFELELKNEFLAEATELIQACEKACTELAEDPTNSTLINEIFRVAHSLKGGALTAGFQQFGDFAHTFEHLLMEIRSGSVSITTDVTELLIEAVDVLSMFTDELPGNFDANINCEDISKRLEAKAGASSSEDSEDPIPVAAKQSRVSTGTPKPKETNSPQTVIFGPEDFGKPKVMVVEDDDELRSVLEEMLVDHNIEVELSSDGQEALLSLAKGYRPDVILADYKMPNMKGDELLIRVKSSFPEIPVVFLSGIASHDDIIRILNEGAYTFMQKPVEEDALILQIRNAVKFSWYRKALIEMISSSNQCYLSMMSKADGVENEMINEMSNAMTHTIATFRSIFKKVSKL